MYMHWKNETLWIKKVKNKKICCKTVVGKKLDVNTTYRKTLKIKLILSRLFFINYSKKKKTRAGKKQILNDKQNGIKLLSSIHQLSRHWNKNNRPFPFFPKQPKALILILKNMHLTRSYLQFVRSRTVRRSRVSFKGFKLFC